MEVESITSSVKNFESHIIETKMLSTIQFYYMTIIGIIWRICQHNIFGSIANTGKCNRVCRTGTYNFCKFQLLIVSSGSYFKYGRTINSYQCHSTHSSCETQEVTTTVWINFICPRERVSDINIKVWSSIIGRHFVSCQHNFSVKNSSALCCRCPGQNIIDCFSLFYSSSGNGIQFNVIEHHQFHGIIILSIHAIVTYCNSIICRYSQIGAQWTCNTQPFQIIIKRAFNSEMIDSPVIDIPGTTTPGPET